MKISVITATVDPDAALARTIRSVCDQSYPDIEHIIVDGIENRPEFDFGCARHIFHAPAGIYEALNFGIAQASGDIIGLVHGGDQLASPDVLANVAKGFSENPNIDFVYGDVRFVSANGAPRRLYSGEHFRPSHLAYGMAPPHPSLYIRRQAASKVGEYRQDFRLAADLDMWMRLFSDDSLHSAYIPQTFVEMAPGGASASWRARLIDNNIEKLKALRLNGYTPNPLMLMGKYILILRNYFICPSKH